jgi:hypothetical protein
VLPTTQTKVPGSDSQKPVLNDNVLYHSRFELASQKSFVAEKRFMRP